MLASYLSLISKIRQQVQPDDEADGPRLPQKQQYEILGFPIALECLATLMGVGKKRFLKASKGVIDLRFGGGVLQPCKKTNTVDKFLFGLHGSIAETLATELLAFNTIPNPSVSLYPLQPWQESVISKVPYASWSFKEVEAEDNPRPCLYETFMPT